MFGKIFKVVALVTIVLFCTLVVFAVLVLENRPIVTKMSAPTPNEVVEARAFVHGVRSSIKSGVASSAEFETNEVELNSVIKLGAHIFSGFRGALTVDEAQVAVNVSIPVLLARNSKWVNVSATVPTFDRTLSLSSVKLGRFSLPPHLSLEVIRIGANIIFGDGFGDKVLTSASSMGVEDYRLTFVLEMNEMGHNGILRSVFGTMRGASMPGPQEVDRYYMLIREAMDRGDLPNEGSYLPYLLFTLEAALEGSRNESLQNAYTSALFALTRACGAEGFTHIVGGPVVSDFAQDKVWETDCRKLTLNGRVDSRRQFTTAAAIQAASNRGFAVSVGEFKELYDSMQSGFDFTDLAANNSGIRMSNRFMHGLQRCRKPELPSDARRDRSEDRRTFLAQVIKGLRKGGPQ